MGKVHDDFGRPDRPFHRRRVADATAHESHARIVEHGRQVTARPRHDAHTQPGVEEPPHDMGADEAGAAKHSHVPCRGVWRSGDRRAGCCGRDGQVTQPFAQINQVRAECAVQFRRLACVDGGMERRDGPAHGLEKRVAARSQLGRRQGVAC